MYHAVAAALVAAMMRDKDIASCAKASGKTARAYVTAAFKLSGVTLRTGGPMIVAIGADECTSRGSSSQVKIFERTAAGYRLVLDSTAIPDFVEVGEDGTADLPEHDTMQTIFEKKFVWNGKAYVFSAARSHMYDVPLGERRPYEVLVRFAPGTFETTLSGSAAINFGEDYVFKARAGQRITVELTKHTVRRPQIILSYGEKFLASVDAGRWSRVLPHTGTYVLTVEGGDLPAAAPISTYAIRLAIR